MRSTGAVPSPGFNMLQASGRVSSCGRSFTAQRQPCSGAAATRPEPVVPSCFRAL